MLFVTNCGSRESPPRLAGPSVNPVRVDGKRLFRFDIGDLVFVKYVHPKPKGKVQKDLVGKTLTGLVLEFSVNPVAL